MNRKFFAILAIALLALPGCMNALQRGMLGNAYISTARPSITLEANDMPLLTAGEGTCNLAWSDMLGGLPITVWLAVYGQGGLAPMVIMAQAQTPEGWHWDGILRRPFSINDSVEVFNGQDYQACTFIIDNMERDPFGSLVTGVTTEGTPQPWLVRAYAARYNFNVDKIIMEYREPLPPYITSLSQLPYGQSDFIRNFEQRARDAMRVAPGPANPTGVKTSYANNIQWQYMGQSFLGTTSQDSTLNFGSF